MDGDLIDRFLAALSNSDRSWAQAQPSGVVESMAEEWDNRVSNPLRWAADTPASSDSVEDFSPEQAASEIVNSTRFPD